MLLLQMQIKTIIIGFSNPISMCFYGEKAVARPATSITNAQVSYTTMNDEIAPLDLYATVAELLNLPIETILEDSNLIELGMDSITMMRLSGKWRQHGIDLTFAELMANPKISAWQALIAKHRLKAEQKWGPATVDIDEAAPFEMALMQHAYWIGRTQDQQLGGVAAHFYNEFDGEQVDPTRLESAVRKLIERHGMLRVQILNDGYQRILHDSNWSGLQVHDLRMLSAEAAQEVLRDLRQRLSHRNMDLAAGEAFDIQISLLPDIIRVDGTRLHVNLDMVAADALSLRVLLGDLAQLYAKPRSPLPRIDYSFPRYLAERETIRARTERTAALQADRAYWRSCLSDLPSAPQLPVASYNTKICAAMVVRRHRWLEPEQVNTLELLARRHGLTPAMALAAVFAETLTSWSSEPRFLLNLPVFDREPLRLDVGHLVGDFTSSVLLRWDGAMPGPFAVRARRLQDQFRADIAHIGYSGVEVLRDLSRARGEQVLAPIVYTSALGLGELFPAAVKQHFGTASWIISQGPQVWLDAQVTELDGGLLVNLDAREGAFAPGVLDAMFEAHGRLLEYLLEDEAAWRQPVPPLLPAEQLRIRAAANATTAPVSGKRLHDGFFAFAEQRPDAPALVWGMRGLMSYGKLRQRALSVAGYLRAQGVHPGDVVVIHMPKGPDQIVAVLGVLAAGAAYLPVGMDQPALRRERIYKAAGVACVLDELPDHHAPLAAPVGGADSDLAYILYTSGSTGEPKGVEIPHVAAMNTIDDLKRRFELKTDDRTLALSALEFDLSVFDIFGPLSVGGAVICVEELARRDAGAWVELLRQHRATLLNCVPALLEMILTAAGDDAKDVALRAVLLGGDWVTLDLYDRLAHWTPDCRFIALGGTTETAIHSTICEVTEIDPNWKSVPYGKPLSNVQLRVVDPLGSDCPDFVPGELYIGGMGVARGYRGDPEKTAEKFLHLDGMRWYRTGDRARYWPGGSVEFLGRADFQVKLRGHRIELGEIEAALGAYPGIGQAVALLGDRGLVAAVTPDNEVVECPIDDEFVDLRQPPAEFAGLRDFLEDRLPAVMIPDHIFRQQRFPLTTNGKIDRKAIQQAVDARGTEDTAAMAMPIGDVERRVAKVWADLLEVPQVGRDHNFFTLGGDSLLATRQVRRLDAAGLADVKLSNLFTHPVLADFAATLRLGENTPASPAWVADEKNRQQPFPPTEVQQAYWLGRDERFTLGGVGCHFYREYEVVDLDLTRLEAAANTLIERHEMLRAVFDEQGQQRILAEVPKFEIEVIDAGENPAQAYEELRRECSHKVYDPARWPLFGIRAVQSNASTRLGISLDNLILDALSILTFYSELSTLYENPGTNLPSIGLSFRDYVLSCAPEPQALAAARAYWQRKLPQLPPAPQLPLTKDPDEVRHPNFIRHEGRINAASWQRIIECAGAYGITHSTILLTAFAEVLSRWSSRPDLTLNLTLFDRKEVHPDIYRVMGDFTSLTLIGYQPEPGESWLTRVQRMQQELGEALEHRDISSVSLVRELARLNGASEVAMPVVFTSALGVPGGTAAPAGGPFNRQIWGLTQTPQVWLDHQVVETDGGIALNWDVVATLFPEGLTTTMFEAYLRMLEWLSACEWTHAMPDLMPAGQRQVRTQVNATDGDWPRHSLHQVFFEIAREIPQQTALRWGESEKMSYGELAERALRLAALLIERGVQPAEIVAVTLPKGPDQIAAVLGVLAAGATYLPIGVDQPEQRRDRMLRHTGTRFVITDLPRRCSAKQYPCLFEQAMTSIPLPGPLAVDEQQLAYVIFTSGSTGEPKGVEITHRSALNTITDINRRFEVGSQDRVLAVSALDFDLSVYDIFGLLSVGGTLVLLEEEARRDAQRWHELACRHGVTVWNSVPALLDMLLTVGGESESPMALRLAMLSGDWIGLDLPGRLAERQPGCRFISMGGATEASIWSNFFEVERVEPFWRSVPYGHPLRNQRFRVVDTHGRDCPDWVAGELWIGGVGVARGYHSAPEVTTRQFLSREDGRWYRTGDLGCYWPDGTLEFLGRADHQVKIRGHRIELGEIEAVLLEHADVEHATAAVIGKGASRRLVAAVVPKTKSNVVADASITLHKNSLIDLSAEQLCEFATMKLPAYMAPERIEVLTELPLNANSKVDRGAIVKGIESRLDKDAKTFEPPQGEWEHRIAALWIELLNVTDVGRQQNFFELGGDSLLATRFIETVKQHYGLVLPLRRLFTGPTLAEVAATINAEHTSNQTLDEGVL